MCLSSHHKNMQGFINRICTVQLKKVFGPDATFCSNFLWCLNTMGLGPPWSSHTQLLLSIWKSCVNFKDYLKVRFDWKSAFFYICYTPLAAPNHLESELSLLLHKLNCSLRGYILTRVSMAQPALHFENFKPLKFSVAIPFTRKKMLWSIPKHILDIKSGTSCSRYSLQKWRTFFLMFLRMFHLSRLVLDNPDCFCIMNLLVC